MVASKSLALIMVLAVVFNLAPRSEAAITCGTVVSYLAPCLPYVTGRGPLDKCCYGIKNLYALAKTTPDRQTVCTCLKNAANSYRSYIRKAASLPKTCGVNLPYTISPYTDCSKIK